MLNVIRKPIFIIFAVLLALLLPLTYLTAKHLTLREQLERLSKKYPSYTDEEIAVIEAVKKVSPSVVSIIARKEVFGFQRQVLDLGNGFQIVIPGKLQSQGKQIVGGGSGFVIGRDGLIATNKHVIADAKAEYEVILPGGQKFPAKVFLKDAVHDLAFVKIENAAQKLRPLSLADSENIRVGQSVIAIGNALGELENSVTKGVVSALNRSIIASEGNGRTVQLDGIIQTDAAINLGNSGGPLLNTNGEVVGMNTAMNIGAENIGFAIPANKIKELLAKTSL